MRYYWTGNVPIFEGRAVFHTAGEECKESDPSILKRLSDVGAITAEKPFKEKLTEVK